METINGQRVHWYKPYSPDGIYNLSKTADGSLYASPCDWRLTPWSALDLANRFVMPVMGFRLFYGLTDKGVTEYLCPGKVTRKVLDAIAAQGVKELWSSTFTASLWLVRGQVMQTIAQVDCKPAQTTKHALAWSRALTGHSYGVTLTTEELAGEA